MGGAGGNLILLLHEMGSKNLCVDICMYVCMKVMTGEKEDNLEKKNKRVRKTLGQKANLKFCTHKLKKRN